MSLAMRLVGALAFLWLAMPTYGACPDVYACTLDARWPTEHRFVVDSGLQRVITVRVVPAQSVDPEQYVVLRVRDAGRFDIEYSVPEGDSLFSQIRRLSKEEKDPEKLARQLTVRTIPPSPTPAIRRLVEAYAHLKINAPLPGGLYLDATRYDIVENAPMNQLSLSIYDDSAHPAQSGVVAWAKELVRACRSAPTRVEKK